MPQLCSTPGRIRSGTRISSCAFGVGAAISASLLSSTRTTLSRELCTNLTSEVNMSSKYAIGVDFGTESGRALLVDVETGQEIATAIHTYANGVIDEKLPESGVRLEPDWALQDPNDYIEVFKNAVPAALKQSRVAPQDVIGLGIDFTACTMLPVKADGTP